MPQLDKSWQARLRQPQDALAVDFVESLTYDRRLYAHDIAGSLAHAEMLREQGLLTRAEFDQISKGLAAIRREIEAGKFVFDKSCEDIHMAIEAALITRIGDAGRKLHTGRSRNDQVALDVRLWMRETIDALGACAAELQKAFVALAEADGAIVMPGYTHLQRAQPILCGNYLLAFVEQLHRDRERLADCRKRVNMCPLGAGALAGSSLPLNRRRVAELLGFDGITRNSIDTIADRDYCVEFVFGCATIALHLSRWAEDWIIYTTQEFSFIRTDDAFCTGSSMMPQKRNPDMLELIRGKCGSVYGNLTALLTMLKGQPLTYNRDMQEDKKQLFDAADTVTACLRMAAAIVSHTRFNAAAIEARLDEGYLDATALAEYLVTRGVPFRQAHQVVGRAVATAEQQGAPLAELPLETLQQHCEAIAADVFQYLGAANVVKRYATLGAAGKRQLGRQLAHWHKKL